MYTVHFHICWGANQLGLRVPFAHYCHSTFLCSVNCSYVPTGNSFYKNKLLTYLLTTSIILNNEVIECSKSVKLLGVTIDNKLDFSEHVTKLCKKVSSKLHALARISNCMSHDKLRILMKSFIESQFSYCPLIWMFHSRTLNNRINRLHERRLRLVCKDSQLNFEELLRRDKSFSIHHRNLQKLAIEMYKVIDGLCPS